METAVYQLNSSLLITATIKCDKCDKTDKCDCDSVDEDVLKHFYSKGWRATLRFTYCKKCAKKFLRRFKK